MQSNDTQPGDRRADTRDPGLYWLAAVILLIVACLAALPFVSSRAADATIAALTTVSDKAHAYDHLLDLLKDAETGQRGYVITGDASFLAPYDAATAEIPDALRRLAALADGPDERATQAEIDRYARLKLDELAKSIALRRADGLPAAAAVVANGTGKAYMDRLRALIGERVDTLERDRHTLRDRLATTLRYNTVLGIVASVASALIIGIALYVVRRSLRERAQAADLAQQQARDQAEQARTSQARSQRLAVTAEMLQAMDSLTDADELRDVLPAFLPKLLPGSAGAVYLYRNSRDFLQRVATWGSAGHHPDLVSPAQCWSLRFGRMHVAGPDDGLRCPHCRDGAPGHTDLCVPMISQGEVLGLLVASVPAGPDAASDEGAANAISEQLALGTSNINLREVLRRQSTVDELTGLYNRRYFDEALRRELFRAERRRAALAVVMIDLDHFKRMNDTYGHEAGDIVLRAVGQVLREGVRRSDVACRYGGEELVLVLPECDTTGALRSAEALRTAIAALELHHGDTLLPDVTASFGIAMWPANGDDAATLLQAADRALYAAKHEGRNRVCTA
ncbi:diguanylate cyclase [Massilia sp. TW-1]|uniref:diguanylate cyclase n=1 Tax=Telluria antibiotica TaxID=2717319 RepID=A0ABX0PD24_9BURK|nr:diguanylate cyclase [Telluria antibiotica]NIA54403.1 diguanylate cyclase [Telluria antibiotica]